MPKIITLTGDLGAGKSLLSKALMSAFEAEYYSTGAAQRHLAEEMGISTLELNKLAEKEKWVDEKIDSIFKTLGSRNKNLIVDSRMAWHFLPQSFKIRLEVDSDIAAKRVSEDTTRRGEAYTDLAQTKEGILKRKQSESARFKEYYNVDLGAHDNYDLVIDTTHAAPEKIAAIAIQNAWAFFDNETPHRNWVSDQSGNVVKA